MQCKKTRKKNQNLAQLGAMRGAGGRGGRVALACITLQVFAGVGAGVCMQDFVRHSTRRWGAADYSNAPRIPPDPFRMLSLGVSRACRERALGVSWSVREHVGDILEAKKTLGNKASGAAKSMK